MGTGDYYTWPVLTISNQDGYCRWRRFGRYPARCPDQSHQAAAPTVSTEAMQCQRELSTKAILCTPSPQRPPCSLLPHPYCLWIVPMKDLKPEKWPMACIASCRFHFPESVRASGYWLNLDLKDLDLWGLGYRNAVVPDYKGFHFETIDWPMP